MRLDWDGQKRWLGVVWCLQQVECCQLSFAGLGCNSAIHDVASPTLLALKAKFLSFAPLLPACPTRVNQVLLNDQISDTECSCKPCAEHPLNPASSAQIGGKGKPQQGEQGTASTANQNLLLGVIAQIYAADGNCSGRG